MGIGEPPITAIQTFEQVLKDYPQSEFKPEEAMFRLAKLGEGIHEYAKRCSITRRCRRNFRSTARMR